jgi:hypothetical protein
MVNYKLVRPVFSRESITFQNWVFPVTECFFIQENIFLKANIDDNNSEYNKQGFSENMLTCLTKIVVNKYW